MYVTFLLSIKNHNLHNYLHLIYPDELEIKYITETDKSASYLDILLGIDSSGRLTTTLYDKRDDFDFSIVKFLFLWGNTPFSTAYCDNVCIFDNWFDTQEHVLPMRTFNKKPRGHIAHLSHNPYGNYIYLEYTWNMLASISELQIFFYFKEY
jgi:hypothetical protein